MALLYRPLRSGGNPLYGAFIGAVGAVALTGAACVQNNACTGGSLLPVGVVQLTGANCTQNNACSGGSFLAAGVVQLTGASCVQGNACSGGAFAFVSAPSIPSIQTGPWKNNAGDLLVGLTIPKIAILKVSDLSTVLVLTARSTDASGLMTISHASLVAGTNYLVVSCDAGGATYGIESRLAS